MNFPAFFKLCAIVVTAAGVLAWVLFCGTTCWRRWFGEPIFVETNDHYLYKMRLYRRGGRLLIKTYRPSEFVETTENGKFPNYGGYITWFPR